MVFQDVDAAELLVRLREPTGPVSVVLDTDAYNEIDDQFALVHALLSPERVKVEAIYAAPFANRRSGHDPAVGMTRSYEEILRLLERLGRDPAGRVYRGAPRWLPGPDEPVASPAAEDLVRRAMAERDGPLYVLAIAAITNIASALLIEPAIRERVVVLWLSGHAYHQPAAREFNLMQDLAASRLIFDCGVPLVHVPCKPVAEQLRTTAPEIERWVKGRGAIGDYLAQIALEYIGSEPGQGRVIWDVAPLAWLIDPSWVPTAVTSSPLLNTELTWSRDERRHPVRVATDVDRAAIFGDLFRKLARAGEGGAR